MLPELNAVKLVEEVDSKLAVDVSHYEPLEVELGLRTHVTDDLSSDEQVG